LEKFFICPVDYCSYFADTLANQEASRHSGSLSTTATSGNHNGDVIMVDSTSLLATPRPLTTAIRMGSSGYNNPQQLHAHSGAMRSATNGQYSTGRTGTSLHCSAFNVA